MQLIGMYAGISKQEQPPAYSLSFGKQEQPPAYSPSFGKQEQPPAYLLAFVAGGAAAGRRPAVDA